MRGLQQAQLDFEKQAGWLYGGAAEMEAPGGVEPPTNGLGNRCSIHLSYGAKGRKPIIAPQFEEAETARESCLVAPEFAFPVPCAGALIRNS